MDMVLILTHTHSKNRIYLKCMPKLITIFNWLPLSYVKATQDFDQYKNAIVGYMLLFLGNMNSTAISKITSYGELTILNFKTENHCTCKAHIHMDLGIILYNTGQ